MNLIDNVLDVVFGWFEVLVEIVLRKGKGGVEVIICDNGVGIVVENFGKIFEFFFMMK